MVESKSEAGHICTSVLGYGISVFVPGDSVSLLLSCLRSGLPLEGRKSALYVAEGFLFLINCTYMI